MDDPLERLIRTLRDDTCPPAVLERVSRRIARDGRHDRRWRMFWAPGLAGALALVVLAVAVLRRDAPPRDGAGSALAQERLDHARILEQTQGALVLIGRILVEAGTQAGNTVRDEAGPPLLESFHTARKQILHSL